MAIRVIKVTQLKLMAILELNDVDTISEDTTMNM